MARKKKPVYSTEEFDRRFEDDESDLLELMDVENAVYTDPTVKRVNVDCPEWMIQCLDREAKRIGIARQSLIKMWLAEKIEATAVRQQALAEQQQRRKKKTG